MFIKQSKSKYNNKKTLIDNISFDSLKEAKRYQELKSKEKTGEIHDLELQKEFELQPNFKLDKKTIRKITYKCDFYYFSIKDNKYIVEDVKGFKTDIYRLKKKLFEYKFKIEIKEI